MPPVLAVQAEALTVQIAQEETTLVVEMSAAREIPAVLTAARGDGVEIAPVPAAAAAIQAWEVPAVVGAARRAAEAFHVVAVECAVAAGGDVSREVKL